MEFKDYYEILEVHRKASKEIIDKAYKTLALKYHPDRNMGNMHNCEEKMKILNEAYEVLTNPTKKQEFDRHYDNYYIRRDKDNTINMNNKQSNTKTNNYENYGTQNKNTSDNSQTNNYSNNKTKKQTWSSSDFFKISVPIVIVAILIFSIALSSNTSKTNNNSNNNNSSNDTATLTTNAPITLEKGPNDKNPIAALEMENGNIIKIELYPEIAPNTVRNFISLSNNGFYNGLTFHRVINDFMIQGGDPKGNGSGGPDYSIGGEFPSNGFSNNLKHTKGVISMARSKNPNSAGSQFFIMLSDYPSLDGEYAAFGKVIEGINVLDTIGKSETSQNDKSINEIKIKTVSIETFGVTYNQPIKFKH